MYVFDPFAPILSYKAEMTHYCIKGRDSRLYHPASDMDLPESTRTTSVHRQPLRGHLRPRRFRYQPLFRYYGQRVGDRFIIHIVLLQALCVGCEIYSAGKYLSANK